MADSRLGSVFEFVKHYVLVVLTCTFALGGVLVGTVAGIVTGLTTQTGFLRGVGSGAVAGGVVAIDLFQSLLIANSLSKIDILQCFINEKMFEEWIEKVDASVAKMLDIFEADGAKGLSTNHIKKLPKLTFFTTETIDQLCDGICCSICLQDFNQGDRVRQLAQCRHLFHSNCIDEWLVIQGSCPICREGVLC